MGMTAAGYERLRPERPYLQWGKPLLDRFLGTLLVVLCAPLMAVVTVLVIVSVGRPVLFRQRRVGEGGQTFTMVKFRTMHPCRRRRADGPPSGRERRVCHKRADDPRLTRVGRWLRRTSLDELPQLWHVVTGDMSLVGPRPELVEVVADYEGWQHVRHQVKPGITGLWQVTERSTGELMHHHVRTDLEYIRRISPATDLTILARTVVVLLGSGRGQ